MAIKHEDSFDKDQFASMLKDVVKQVYEDVDHLGELKKLFKKNVPWNLRSYAAAYLAKQYFSATSKNGYRRKERADRNSVHNFKSQSVGKSEDTSAKFESKVAAKASTRVVIPEELASTAFIGIGRNRKVFPRDLIGLITQVAEIERERIGSIRVLDNYSFVQLYTEDVDKLIEKLNGYEFRGRKLSVDYSHKKEEDAANSSNESIESSEPETLI